MGQPHVVIVTMEDDYGIPDRGASYEKVNLVEPLRQAYPDTIVFDYMRSIRAAGRERMNEECVSLVKQERPDLTIVTLYTDQFEPSTIHELSRWTRTIAYFFDDIWRADYAVTWARHFDMIATPDPDGPARYARNGIKTAIWCPFAFNDVVYRRQALPKRYDVSFIGAWHPYRAWIQDRLTASGINVASFGSGWPAGRVPAEEAVQIINASKICLNLWNGSEWELGYVLSSPRALSWTLRTRKSKRFVNGRTFELAGCGAFQITFATKHLSKYFRIGREVVVYRDSNELVRQILYFLEADDERESIAEAGHARAQVDHRATDRLRTLVESALAWPRPQKR